MASVSHLIDAEHPAAAVTLASLLHATPDIDHDVYVRGAAARHELAELGVSCTTMPARAPEGRIVAWSAHSAAAAAWLWRQPLAWVAFEPPTGWRALLLRWVNATPLCFTEQLAATLGGRLVEPVFAPRLLGARNGHAWARQDGDRVIALLSDDPRRVDAAGGVLTVAVVEEAARDQPGSSRLRLLAHPDAASSTRGRRIADDSGSPHRFMVDPEMAQPWRLLASCDAALLCGPHTELAAAWAAAAGIPAFSAETNDVRALAAALRAAVCEPDPRSTAPAEVASWRQAMA